MKSATSVRLGSSTLRSSVMVTLRSSPNVAMSFSMSCEARSSPKAISIEFLLNGTGMYVPYQSASTSCW